MKPLPNFNFDSLTTSASAISAIEQQIRLLIKYVAECNESLVDADKTQLVQNILWIKRYYETAERLLLDDK